MKLENFKRKYLLLSVKRDLEFSLRNSTDDLLKQGILDNLNDLNKELEELENAEKQE